MSGVPADASFEEQYNAITEAVERLYTATPAANKFYRVTCPLFTTNKAMFVDGENLRWKTVDATDNSFIWSFVQQADGTYAMRNAVDGRYVSTVTGNNGQYKALAEASSVTLQRISENDQQVLIKHNMCMHCGGHSNGAGSNGNIIGWQTAGDASSASSWYLESISDDEDAALREHYLAPITSLPEWAQQEYAEQIAMMRNPETSTSDLMDAAFSLSNLVNSNEYVGKVIKIRSSVSGRETKHACMGNANLSARIKMADLNDGADPSDFLFYYTADHKLVHIASNRSFNSSLQACEYGGTSVAEITLTPANTAHTYYVHTSTYYAHEHDSSFDGCSSNTISGHDQNHSLYIDVVEPEDIKMMLDKLPEPTVESAGFTLGNEPGQLIENTEFDWAARWEECKQNVANNFSLEAYAQLQDIREVGIGRYTVAPAQTGRMYRIKSTPLNHKHNDCSAETPLYLSNINNNNNTNNSCRSTFVTEPSDATIWFFAEGGYLVSVENGRYIVPNVTGNSPFIKLHAGTLPAGETPTEHGALKIALSAANAPEVGAYKITFPDKNNRSVHLSMSKTDGVATSGEANCCGSAGNADYAHNFYLEPVTELTATINQDGFGAFVAPVDVTFPQEEGLTVYTKQILNKVTKESKFMELRAGEVVRAGVPVLLHGSANSTCTVNVVYPTAEEAAGVSALSDTDAAEEDPALITVHGTHVAQLCAPAEGKAVYALSTTVTTDSKDSEEEIHFDRVEAGEQMPIGTMLLTLADNHQIITEDGAKAVIGLKDTFTTGIKTIELHNLDGTVVIYDLQGRRLSAPAKGVNIINGKKVLVK